MSYIPQPGSIAARAVALFRADAKLELTGTQLAERLDIRPTAVTACLSSAVTNLLLARVQSGDDRGMVYVAGRKLNDAAARSAVAPAPSPEAAVKRQAAPARAPTPAKPPAPIAAPVSMLMQPKVQPPAAAPTPKPPLPTRVQSLLERLPKPEELKVSSLQDEELAKAVAAYDSLLSGLRVGQYLIVPPMVGDDVLRVCSAWAKGNRAHFRVTTCTDDEMRIERAA
ncbi:hypothetical protein [Aquincola sp. J276]|uniref:hypothetical protein n=1 Tax=Aquincola sp. J276 TaxID=2898432 RepID=UPI002151CAC7|nr:hypothetical protein [Aquincola sp. J276]MCR5864677.1 hypothetical protein [Aquincola sp. J276]